MKRLNRVKGERDLILAHKGARTESEKKKARKELEFLNVIILYLETSPSKIAVERQLKTVNEKLHEIAGIFIKRYPTVCPSDHKQRFRKEHNMQNLEEQKKKLEYILS